MSHQLHLCYSINDFFAREAGISLISFFENNPSYGPEEVFILDYGIHPTNKGNLCDIAARYGRRITYLNAKAVTDVVKQAYPHLKAWRGSMAPNAKCFVGHIFPTYVERLLFLDADTVVTGSVSELQELDMQGAALGAVLLSQASCEISNGKLKLCSGNSFYFNSGVLLFDLTAWRHENCHQLIIQTLQKKIDLEWPDQTLLNNAIPELLIKQQPLKYNYLSHYMNPQQERSWLQLGHFHTNEEIEEAITHPAIIHYIGGWTEARPWYEGCRSHRQDDYFRYKALSPWKDTPLFPPYNAAHLPKTPEEQRIYQQITAQF